MSITIISLFVACMATIASLVLMPFIIYLSHRYKWYDLPDNRKIHTGLIPRLGGVVIFISFLLTVLLFSIVSSIITNGMYQGLIDTKYIVILLGLSLVHLLGLIDDFYSLNAILKLGIQCLASVVIVCGGFVIRSFALPYLGTIELGYLAYPFTVFWMVGIANAINLVDGMDGLAGGISGFAALAMGIIALITGHFDTALVAFALLGGIIGFLFYNLPPARIFMGDSGSLFIGFALAVIPLMGISQDASTGSILIPVTLLTVPILDTLAAIIRRIKKKIPIIAPDKEHIHHKLLELGMTEIKILTIIYSICLYLSIVSITSVILPRETNIYLIMTVWVGSMLAYYTLELVRTKKFTEKRIGEEEKIAVKDENSTTAG